jgi:hypothetical protein
MSKTITVSPNMLGHLRTKLAGFERSLGETVHIWANHERQQNGEPLKRVHGWIEVRKANPDDQLATCVGIDWIAYLHARLIDGTVYTVPVIPDEFNPRPGHIVRPDDAPHIFHLMQDAEDYANQELPGFVRYIEGKL